MEAEGDRQISWSVCCIAEGHQRPSMAASAIPRQGTIAVSSGPTPASSPPDRHRRVGGVADGDRPVAGAAVGDSAAEQADEAAVTARYATGDGLREHRRSGRDADGPLSQRRIAGRRSGSLACAEPVGARPSGRGCAAVRALHRGLKPALLGVRGFARVPNTPPAQFGVASPPRSAPSMRSTHSSTDQAAVSRRISALSGAS